MEFRHIFQRITKVLRITETIIEPSLPKQTSLRVFLICPEKAAGLEGDRDERR